MLARLFRSSLCRPSWRTAWHLCRSSNSSRTEWSGCLSCSTPFLCLSSKTRLSHLCLGHSFCRSRRKGMLRQVLRNPPLKPELALAGWWRGYGGLLCHSRKPCGQRENHEYCDHSNFHFVHLNQSFSFLFFLEMGSTFHAYTALDSWQKEGTISEAQDGKGRNG